MEIVFPSIPLTFQCFSYNNAKFPQILASLNACLLVTFQPMKNLKIIFIFCVTLASAIGLSACASRDRGKLEIGGSSTVYPLATKLAQNYESQHLGVKIEVRAGGSHQGIRDVRQGLADIGMVSRSLKEDEQDLLEFPIARDGISIILHRENPVASLTNEQIIDIYTNKINNWQQVGGQDVPITVVTKSKSHATLELFVNYFGLQASEMLADVTIGDNEEALEAVIGNPNAIAYVSIGTAEYKIVRGIPLKLIPIEGVDATISNVRNETFPISRTLNFVVETEPTGLTKDFIDFARSQAANSIVKDQAFIPISQ